MSSDDTNTQRVSTDLLEKLIRRVHVDELETMPAPWDHDIGQATVRDQVFGKLALPVVQDGQVIWNADIVEAERIDPKDQGEVIVIDVSELDWETERAELFALGEFTAAKNLLVDQQMLADWVLRLREWDQVATEMVGWDDAELDALMEAIERDSTTFDDDGDDAPPSQRTGLAVLDVSVDDPKHEVVFGQVWQVGQHVLCVVSVMRDHATWGKHLDEGCMFVPYPSPFMPVAATVPQGVRLVLVQPEPYLAGHLLDKWTSVHGEHSVGLL